MEPVMNRRDFLKLGVLFSVSGCFFYGHRIEPNWLTVSRLALDLVKEPSRTIKLVHLADIHYSPGEPMPLALKAVEISRRERPDLICLTGDFVNNPRRKAGHELVEVLQKFSDIAPTFACLGNHDGGKWSGGSTYFIRDTLSEAGIVCLHNAASVMEVGGAKFRVVGVGDAWSGEMLPGRAFDGIPPEESERVILLSHNPDSKAALRRYPWKLMLSGHTHGGQMTLPFLGWAPMSPIGDSRYVAGLSGWGKRLIHVTRGIWTALEFRLNCRPEVAVIEVGI